MTDSSLEGMHGEYTFFRVFLHLGACAEICRNLVKPPRALSAVSGSNSSERGLRFTRKEPFMWNSSIQDRKANTPTFLFKENCRTCRDISADRPESFLPGGINHRWEGRSCAVLMAKLETQTRSKMCLHTACCLHPRLTRRRDIRYRSSQQPISGRCSPALFS